MPADHLVSNSEAFRAAAAIDDTYAGAGKFVKFGIRPIRAETGYGHIRLGKTLDGRGGELEIAVFVEKPDAAAAERHVISNENLWNSGIFMMRASEWLDQLNKSKPEIVQACRAAFASRIQVKRIVVNPGASPPLQIHHHRAEHWVVVRGTARVTRGKETFLVSENESTQGLSVRGRVVFA